MLSHVWHLLRHARELAKCSWLWWVHNKECKFDGFLTEVVFAVVSHYNEGEVESVVVLRSKQDLFCHVGLHKVVIVNKQVTAIWVQNDEAKVSLFIKELESACLSLGKVLDLSYDMFGVCTIFHLILRELGVHLVQNILSCLLIIEGLSGYEHLRCYLGSWLLNSLWRVVCHWLRGTLHHWMMAHICRFLAWGRFSEVCISCGVAIIIDLLRLLLFNRHLVTGWHLWMHRRSHLLLNASSESLWIWQHSWRNIDWSSILGLRINIFVTARVIRGHWNGGLSDHAHVLLVLCTSHTLSIGLRFGCLRKVRILRYLISLYRWLLRWDALHLREGRAIVKWLELWVETLLVLVTRIWISGIVGTLLTELLLLLHLLLLHVLLISHLLIVVLRCCHKWSHFRCTRRVNIITALWFIVRTQAFPNFTGQANAARAIYHIDSITTTGSELRHILINDLNFACLLAHGLCGLFVFLLRVFIWKYMFSVHLGQEVMRWGKPVLDFEEMILASFRLFDFFIFLESVIVKEVIMENGQALTLIRERFYLFLWGRAMAALVNRLIWNEIVFKHWIIIVIILVIRVIMYNVLWVHLRITVGQHSLLILRRHQVCCWIGETVCLLLFVNVLALLLIMIEVLHVTLFNDGCRHLCGFLLINFVLLQPY